MKCPTVEGSELSELAPDATIRKKPLKYDLLWSLMVVT